MMTMEEIFIKHHQVGLRLVGAWPASAPLLPGYYFAMGISALLMGFALCNVAEVYADLEALMDNLVSTIGCALGLCKITIFRLKHKHIMLIIDTICEDHLRNSSNTARERSQAMMQNSARSRFISKCIISLYNCMNVTYVLRSLASYLLDEVQQRKFLAQVTLPVDGRQSPLYECIFVGQLVTASICFNSHALVEGLLVSMVLHACSKIDVVQKEIDTFAFASASSARSGIALKQLARKHLEFVQFCQIVQDIFSTISFFHIVSLTLLQVTSAYLLLDGLERASAEPIIFIHNATLAMSFLISTGYYCIVGQYLTNQSEAIFDRLYNCRWYNFCNEHKRAVSFMLARAREPVRLPVGKFSHLSLIYLTSIMKTSFSYLSVVRAAR